MPQSPYFSIVLPTYNRAWILGRAISSVCAQNDADWELVVVDDGSTDETAGLVTQFQEQDARIHLVQQVNGGAAMARQQGLAAARGEWIMYLDSDDQLYADCVSTVRQYLAKHPAVRFGTVHQDRFMVLHDMTHTELARVEQPPTDLAPSAVTLQAYYHWRMKPCGTGIFHRTDQVRGGIHWKADFSLMEDIDFLMQLGVHCPDGFAHIPQRLFLQEQVMGGDGVCAGASYGEWADAFEKLYLTHQADPLMAGQPWYPKKVKQYQAWQKQYEAGAISPAAMRYFPEWVDRLV